MVTTQLDLSAQAYTLMSTRLTVFTYLIMLLSSTSCLQCFPTLTPLTNILYKWLMLIWNVALFREGVYGDVHRVKILFNKKDNALIQMAEPHQAQLGRYKLSNYIPTAQHMGCAMRKCVFGYTWTVKAQIRLRRCSIWSGPSLSTNRISGYYRVYEWRAKAWMILCTCAGWSVSANFAHVLRHCFAWHGRFWWKIVSIFRAMLKWYMRKKYLQTIWALF